MTPVAGSPQILTCGANGDMTAGLDGNGMTYDGENRPVSVTYAGRTTTYVYGADGARLKKVETDPVTQAQEVTLHMGPVEIRKYGEGAAEEILLYPHPNIRIVKTKSGSTVTTRVNTLHLDGLGSVRAVTDENGEVTERTVYRPFGEEVALQQALTVPETKGFIGERYDDQSGLQYLNARYYDPKLAMFIQPDWWEVTQQGVGTNRYSYGFGDPVNAKDPSGHDAVGYEGHYGVYPTFQENTWTENRFLRALDNTARTILNTPSSAGNLFADGIYGVGELLAPHEGALVNLAMTTPTAADDIGAVAVSKFARLSAAVSEKAALRITAINPNRLRFSQTSAGGGNPPRALAYREQMQAGNWGGPPIDVVRTESGSFVAIDNTRLAIAQELGFRKVPVRVHAMGEALPEGMAGQRGWGGSKTWGDALKVRTSDSKLSIDGTSARPRMPGTANTSSASGGGLGGFLSRLFGG